MYIFIDVYNTNFMLQVDKYTGEFKGCVNKCIDKHMKMIPILYKKMISELSKEVYEKVPDSIF